MTKLTEEELQEAWRKALGCGVRHSNAYTIQATYNKKIDMFEVKEIIKPEVENWMVEMFWRMEHGQMDDNGGNE